MLSYVNYFVVILLSCCDLTRHRYIYNINQLIKYKHVGCAKLPLIFLNLKFDKGSRKKS